MIRFIGDLSKEDAELLFHLSMKHFNILEFGAGGSTQIFAQGLPQNLWSVETDPEWIGKTKANLALLPKKTDPVFLPFGEFPKRQVDLIFVDGVWAMRLNFALSAWPLLAPDGIMVFHDTRRWFDAQNVFSVCNRYSNEVQTVDMNLWDTNCSIVRKRMRTAEYVNWNESEGKPKWAYGAEENPTGKLWEQKI